MTAAGFSLVPGSGEQAAAAGSAPAHSSDAGALALCCSHVPLTTTSEPRRLRVLQGPAAAWQCEEMASCDSPSLL